MNFYNPYYYTLPTNLVQPKVGLLGRLFGKTGVTISGFLNGTQRVLNIANQTIPLVKQVKPMIGNAKTMFKVMNEFKKADIPNTKKEKDNNTNLETYNKEEKNNDYEQNYGPTFFV